jgi:hypothetical protein
MREDITFGSSSACRKRVAGAYRPHFCCKPASSTRQSATLTPCTRCLGAPREGELPYFGNRSAILPPDDEGDRVELCQTHILKGHELYGPHSTEIGSWWGI